MNIDSNSPTDAIELAVTALQQAVVRTQHDADPDFEDLYQLHGGLIQCLQGLVDLSAALQTQIPRYGDKSLRSNDGDGDPEARLRESAFHLKFATSHLDAGLFAAKQSWNTLSGAST